MSQSDRKSLFGALSLSVLLSCATPQAPQPVSGAAAPQPVTAPAPATALLGARQDVTLPGVFSIEALTPGYLERKIRTWLSTGQDARLVREIEYARLVHPQALIDIVQTHPELYGGDGSIPGIGGVQAVSDYRGLSQDFDAYLAQLAGGPGGAGGFVWSGTVWGDQPGTAASATAPTVLYPADVAINDSGATVVIWLESQTMSQPFALYARRYDALGNPEGAAIRIDSEAQTITHMQFPQVALDNAGNVAVAWTSFDADAQMREIYSRYLPASGAAPAPVRVNTATAGNQLNAGLAMDCASGNYAVGWLSTDDHAAHLQRFSPGGAPDGDNLSVSATAINTVSLDNHLAMAYDGSDGLMMAWMGPDSDGDPFGLIGRHVASDDSLGPELHLNTRLEAQHSALDLAGDGQGGFVAAWGEFAGSTPEHVFARRFDAQGPVDDAEFQVDPGTGELADHLSTAPSVAVRPDGRFLIGWTGIAPGYSAVDAFYTTFAADGTAQAPVKINPNGLGLFPALAVNATQLAAAWTRSTDMAFGSSSIQFKRD